MTLVVKYFLLSYLIYKKKYHISGDCVVEHISKRRVFEFEDEFYRVSEICFNKPFIVLEVGI